MSPLIAGITLACALSAGFEVALAAQPAAKAQAAEPAQPATKAQAPTAGQPATKPHASAAAPAQREITYDDLSKEIGKRVIVHTKLGTVRSGILTKVSKSSIDVKLDSDAELSIPADGIRSLSVPVGPPDPLYPTAGEPRAKTK